jgi:hypothetical protein
VRLRGHCLASPSIEVDLTPPTKHAHVAVKAHPSAALRVRIAPEGLSCQDGIATARLARQDRQPLSSVRVSNGAFTLIGLPAEEVELEVTCASLGSETTRLDLRQSGCTLPPREETVVFNTAGLIFGRVVIGNSEEPAAGISIAVRRQGEGSATSTTVTDAGGYFAARELPPALYHVEATNEGGDTLDSDLVDLGPGSPHPSLPVLLRVPRPTGVSIEVRDLRGRPLAHGSRLCSC